MTCALGSCPDRPTSTVRFHYENGSWVDVRYCSRHSWPWRAGQGNGTADVTWT